MSALSQIAAEERILFGSDWPFCNERVVTEEIMDFAVPGFLPPAKIANIARENVLKLFPQRA
jgi:predicted TIM-barrel fold metal-dependent hydrolase